MRESIVFLFYLLAPYISTSREKGHTETGAKDTKLLNTLRLHRLRLLLKFRKLATLDTNVHLKSAYLEICGVTV